MKIKIACSALLSAALSAAAAGNFAYLVNGPAFTNFNAAYNSGTNSSGVVTNNFQVGTVNGSTAVAWQLSGGSGLQPFLGTNAFLPSASFSTEQNSYPGTANGPANKLTIAISFSIMATNASSTDIPFQFAASIDGVNWKTNWATLTPNVPINSTAPVNVVSTNLESYGWQFVNLQLINNTGAAAMTNIVVTINAKPGL